jgi:lipid A 3-O-deacylase
MHQNLVRPLTAALALGLAGLALPASAIDRVAFEYGMADGDTDVDRYGGTVTFDWGVEWFRTGGWALTGYWEVGVNVWDSDGGRTGEDTLVDGHVTPVLRWQRDLTSPLPVFLEVGVGAHGYTEEQIEDKDFTLPFAFGSHVGAGVRLGEGGRYELLYRYQHQSNANLGDDNPGINFHLFTVGYYF